MTSPITEILDSADLDSAIFHYEKHVAETDRFSVNEINPIVLGLYGEVGSLMSASKKYRRESTAFAGFKESVEEEFGDALWYFAALCRRYSISLADLLQTAGVSLNTVVGSGVETTHTAEISKLSLESVGTLEPILLDLGIATANLLKLGKDSPEAYDLSLSFARLYLQALASTGLSLISVSRYNLGKAKGRFVKPPKDSLPTFDSEFEEEEQIPRKFEIHITQRKSGRTWLQWNGVFIGAPLSDNILDEDGYRFHDVFHFAHAAILHWSPTFRALINQKRKSDPTVDDSQDGGRAIVVEEGLSAWLFSYAKGLNYFEGHNTISFDVLKVIQKFVHGYEVEQCPLKLWEDAILQGYSVFRQVRDNRGGIVIGDRDNRSLTYRSFGD